MVCLYALAGFSGGVTCYVKDGFLNYEFNLFEVERTKVKSSGKLPVGKAKIEVESKLKGPNRRCDGYHFKGKRQRSW